MATAKKKPTAKKRTSTSTRRKLAAPAMTVTGSTEVLSESNGMQYVHVPLQDWARMVQQQNTTVNPVTMTTYNGNTGLVESKTVGSPSGRLHVEVSNAREINFRIQLGLTGLNATISRLIGEKAPTGVNILDVNPENLIVSLENQHSQTNNLLDELFTSLQILDQLI